MEVSSHDAAQHGLLIAECTDNQGIAAACETHMHVACMDAPLLCA